MFNHVHYTIKRTIACFYSHILRLTFLIWGEYNICIGGHKQLIPHTTQASRCLLKDMDTGLKPGEACRQLFAYVLECKLIQQKPLS